jgi:hypothetical protein
MSPFVGASQHRYSTDQLIACQAVALQFNSEEQFVEALVRDIPPAPPQQAQILGANRSSRPLAEAGLT